MSWAVLILGIGAFASFSLALSWAVGRSRRSHALRSDTEQAGVKIAAAFGIYGIILGFAVVVTQQSFMDVEDSLREGSGALRSITRLADTLPADQGQPILGALRIFIATEIQEWETLKEPGGATSSAELLQDVYDNVQSLSIHPESAAAQAGMFDALRIVDLGRADRALISQDGLPGLFWLLLFGGGALVLAMAALLHFESNTVRALLLSGMAALIGLALFTVWALSHPFTGPVPIDPGPLQHALDLIPPTT